MRPRIVVCSGQQKAWSTNAIPILLRVKYPRANSPAPLLFTSWQCHEKIIPCDVIDATAFANEVIEQVRPPFRLPIQYDDNANVLLRRRQAYLVSATKPRTAGTDRCVQKDWQS